MTRTQEKNKRQVNFILQSKTPLFYFWKINLAHPTETSFFFFLHKSTGFIFCIQDLRSEISAAMQG